MIELCACLGCNVGSDIPDFTPETYEPSKGGFSEISLRALKKTKK